MGLENVEPSLSKTTQEAAGAFAGGFLDVFRRPVQGARQLATGEQPEHEKAAEGTVASAAAAAGSMVGNAALFIGSTMLTSRLPFVGKVMPYAIGGGVGFLDPTTSDQGIGTRLTHGLTGAATIGLLQYGPKGLGSLEASWIPKSDLGRLSLTNAAAGAINVQSESLLRDGRIAGMGEMTAGATTWMAMGAAFHGAGKLLESRSARPPATNETAADLLPGITIRAALEGPRAPAKTATPAFIDLPALELNKASNYANKISVPADSPLAQLYGTAQQAVARTEVLQIDQGRFGGGMATSVAVRDGNGNMRFLSTNHLTEKAVDVVLYDRTGMGHAAEVVKGSETLDLAVLRLKNPAAEKRFSTLELSDENATVKADDHFAAVGFAAGWDKPFISEGVPIITPGLRGTPTVKFALRGEEGLCGAPICNVNDGKIAAIYKQADALSDDTSGGTTARHARGLLGMASLDETARPGKPANQHLSLYRVDNAIGLRSDLEGIFGKTFWSDRAPEFFHSRVRTISLASSGSTHDIGLKTQFFPQQRIVIAEPVSLNGNRLTGSETWPNTDIPLAGARLGIRMNENGIPTTLRAFNDPLDILPRAFERPYTHYLPNVTPARRIPLITLKSAQPP